MTKNDKEKLIEAIWYQMPSITLHDKNTGNETIVVEVGVLKDFIRSFECEPTEGSTEAVKEPECACEPNYKVMYEEMAEQNAVLQHMNGMLERSLDRARASLRTFEFVYGRTLDGIC